MLLSLAASYLVGDIMLSKDAGGSAEFLKLGNEGCNSSRLEPVDPYTVRLFLLKAGEYFGRLVVLLFDFQGGDGITSWGLLLVVVCPVLHLLVLEGL
jgi:hypothetical protein